MPTVSPPISLFSGLGILTSNLELVNRTCNLQPDNLSTVPNLPSHRLFNPASLQPGVPLTTVYALFPASDAGDGVLPEKAAAICGNSLPNGIFVQASSVCNAGSSLSVFPVGPEAAPETACNSPEVDDAGVE